MRKRLGAGGLWCLLVVMSLAVLAGRGWAGGPYRWPEPPPEIGDPDMPPDVKYPGTTTWLRALSIRVYTGPRVVIVHKRQAGRPLVTFQTRLKVGQR